MASAVPFFVTLRAEAAAAQVQALKLELARLKKANVAKGKAPDLDRSQSAFHRPQARQVADPDAFR